METTLGVDEVTEESLAFEPYVQARWARLVRAAVLLGVDRHAAEDVVQTALARCFFKWERVSQARDADAYVHRVLINTVNAGRRRRWTGEYPTADVPEQPHSGEADRVNQHRALMTALGRLPVSQREAVVLRYYADLTEAQAAEAMGVAVGTVKSRCARAMATLAADPALQDEEDR